MFDGKSVVVHLKLFFTTSVMAYQQFTVGGVFGFSAVMLSQLHRPDSDFHVDAGQASWIASLPLLLCPVGSLTTGYLSDRFGRRAALQLTYIPLLISWTILSNARSVEYVYVARLLAGLTTGSGGVIFVYIAETSPTGTRPFYLLISTMYVGLGMMTAAALGAVYNWKIVAAVFAVSCAVGFVAPFFVPATPMWLRSRGRDEEARRAELWFGFEVPRCNGPPAAAVQARADDAPPPSAPGVAPSRWATYAGPTVWKPAIAALAFFFCQQATGFYMLLFYSVDVFRDCRVPVDGMTATVYLSAARLTGTVVNLVFQSAPKRWLTVISGLGMGVALSFIIGYIYTVDTSLSSGGVAGNRYVDVASGLVLWAFLLYVFFAMFAVLPLPWSMCGEMFPMAVKGTMNGVLHSCGYELMFGAIKVYPWLVGTFGIRPVWTACAGFCFATALFGAFLLPETTGKTLDEITDGFRSRKKAKPQLITAVP